jgi:hypothetical protein
MKILMVVIAALFVGELSYLVADWCSLPERETAGEASFCPPVTELDPPKADPPASEIIHPQEVEIRPQTLFRCSECGAVSSASACCEGATLTKVRPQTDFPK